MLSAQYERVIFAHVRLNQGETLELLEHVNGLIITLSLNFLKFHLHIGNALYAKDRLLVGILVSGPNHQALNAFTHIKLVVAPLTMRVLCGCLLNPVFWGKCQPVIIY